jgi:hypothetical protein
MDARTCSLALGLLLLSAINPVHARSLGLGMGAVLGEPVGASASYRFQERIAVQAHLGWRFSQHKAHLGVDGIIDLIDIPTDDAMGFHYPLYMGLGLRLLSRGSRGSKGGLGLRIPTGVAVIPDASPIEVFFELAPVLAVVPAGPVGLDAVLGGRVVF